MNRVKNILIVSYAFPPVARSGIYRIMHFSDYLARRGNYRPHILTVSDDSYEKDDHKDYAALKNLNKSLLIYRTDCRQLRESFLSIFAGKVIETVKERSCYPEDYKKGKKASTIQIFWQKIKDIITDEILSFPDRQAGWLPFAVRYGYNIICRRKIDLIFSTGGPWTSLLIGRILSGLTRVPLVLDYRDPWLDNPFHNLNYSKIFNLSSRLLERWIVNRADAVILNTDSLKQAFVKRYGKHNKFHVLHNGFLEEELRTDAKIDFSAGRDDFIFIHAGAIYGNRSIDNFLVAFKECLQRNLFGKRQAKICLVGADADSGGKCRSILGEQIFKKCCILSERIPHENCIAYLRRSHCFLIFQQNTAIQVPRKLFEYLALRKPILAVTPENGETARIINKNEAGIVVSDRVENIADAIEDMVINYKYHKNRLVKNEGYKRFDMKALTGELEKILDSVIKK